MVHSPLVIGGYVHAPYFIFVRAKGRLSDEELLARLGLGGLERHEPTEQRDGSSGVWMANDAQWVHVMDDWAYTLWHMESIRASVVALAVDYDVFTCSVGDQDDSFDFEYHRDGVLVRKVVMASDDWPFTCVLETDFGEPLPVEAELTHMGDALPRLLRIAASVGIELDPEAVQYRFYAWPQSARE